jgi:hypothetical protein
VLGFVEKLSELIASTGRSDAAENKNGNYLKWVKEFLGCFLLFWVI